MKHKLIFISLFCSALFSQHFSMAQSRTLTLQQSIDLSITNSKSLKINQAKIEEAAAVVKEAKEKRLPEASISGSYLYLPVKPDINLKTGNNPNETRPKVTQAIYGIANISMPIFTGGKLKYGIESAHFLEQAIQLDADGNKEQIILNTINAFINLYKASATVSLVKENLQQANQMVKEFADLEKNGLLARNDLLKAQLQASNIELALLDAESNLKLTFVNMNLMLGLPEHTELIPDSASLLQNNTLKTIDEYEQIALQNRKDLAALSFRKKAVNAGIKTLKSDYFPAVALTGGYVAADIPKFLTITNAVNFGIGVQYNLSSFWKTKTKITQAKAQSQQISITEELLSDNIRLQINEAYQNYLLSQKKIEVYTKAVDQSAENYRITKNKYNNALVTTTDLLDADIAQLQARLNLSNAKADAVAAYNRLMMVTGTLHN